MFFFWLLKYKIIINQHPHIPGITNTLVNGKSIGNIIPSLINSSLSSCDIELMADTELEMQTSLSSSEKLII